MASTEKFKSIQRKAGKHPKRLACLTNIPTPYRLHLFQVFSEELAKRGWSFEVWFMAESEPGRHWEFQPSDFEFRCRFLLGRTLDFGGTAFHFNPSVVGLLHTDPPDILLLSGAWIHPTTIFAALCTKLLSDTTVLFWSESHLDSRAHSNPLVNKSRSLLFLMFDGFAVPGSLALRYTEHYAPSKPTYVLPNTVDESVFRDRTLKYREKRFKIRSDFGIAEDSRVLLLPARLSPKKGIMPFLSAVSSSLIKRKVTLLLAGDGPLRGQVAFWVEQHPKLDVRVLGHVSEDEMAKLYAIADTFVLPSLSDPNPLSVIEALWAELPLILSDRVGNHPETLEPGENGWLLDPESANGTQDVVEEWGAISDEGLRFRGKASARIAKERFETESVVNNFLYQILDCRKASGVLKAQG